MVVKVIIYMVCHHEMHTFVIQGVFGAQMELQVDGDHVFAVAVVATDIYVVVVVIVIVVEEEEEEEEEEDDDDDDDDDDDAAAA